MPSVLGDLAMQSVGNPTRVNGQISGEKIDMVGARIYDALRFQPALFKFAPTDASLLMYFLSTNLSSLSEDDLYEESRRREPLKPAALASPGRDAAAGRRSSSSVFAGSAPSSSGSISRIFSKVRTRRGSIFIPQASMGSGPAARSLASSSSPNLIKILPTRPPPSSVSAPVPIAAAVSARSPFSAVPAVANIAPIPVGGSVNSSHLVSSREDAKALILSLSRDLTASADVALKDRAKKNNNNDSNKDYNKGNNNINKDSEVMTRLQRSGSWPFEKPRMKASADPGDVLPLMILPREALKRKTSSYKPPKEKQELSCDEDTNTSDHASSATSSPLSSARLMRPDSASPAVAPNVVTRIMFPASLTSQPAPKPEVLTTRASAQQLTEYETLRSLKEPAVWNVREVGVWLGSLGLDGYKPLFESNCVKGADLADLTDADLAELGVAKIGHKKVLLQSIGDLFSRRSTPSRLPANKSPRPSAAAVLLASPRGGAGRPKSPRQQQLPAALQPLSPKRADLVGTLFVKIKHKAGVTVVESTRLLVYEELSRLCARVVGEKVKTLHFVDLEKETTLLRGEKDLEFVLDSLPTPSCTILVNK
jgi:hypothetical protein